MKIPKESNINIGSTHFEKFILPLWEAAALQAALDFGVYVVVKYDMSEDVRTNYYGNKIIPIDRIYFVAEGHEFESLNDLKKALGNKAFL